MPRTFVPERSSVAQQAMTKDFQDRFLAVLLFMFTAAAVVFGWYNFRSEAKFEVPSDGVWWIEHHGRIIAQRVDEDGPGARGGIHVGDIATAVNDETIHNVGGLTRQLYRTGIYSKAIYSLIRSNVPVTVPVILVPVDKSINPGLRLIALIYLGIGLYVLMRRWTAPRATHFYLFCLASFIFFSFHYTGKFNAFDWIVYWSSIVAELLQPALFLHFVLTFPEPKRVIREHRWVAPCLYLPGLILVALHSVCVVWLEPSEMLRYALDRAEMS